MRRRDAITTGVMGATALLAGCRPEPTTTVASGREIDSMITLRRADDRFHTDMGWLDSRHTFSFGGHYDPRHMGFRALRVINDDRVTAGAGFPTHGHRDMEILSYVLEGALEHRDSMGTGSVIRPGDVQRMSAGSGVLHSEYNPQADAGTRFLQIWIVPERGGITPSYEQKRFDDAERRGRLRLVASRDGREGSIHVHQDVDLYASLLGAGERAELALRPGRHAWVQVARGSIQLGDQTLREGDGASLSDEARLAIEGREDSEVLVFDLA
ncbi:Quercetin 2,3-dioxygenase [Sandaracinus amylolyticus]|nr:Quercetin 2,3-dioxygenase [Sandaracinus amylolyticus]